MSRSWSIPLKSQGQEILLLAIGLAPRRKTETTDRVKKKACINVEKEFDRQVMYDALNKSNKIFI